MDADYLTVAEFTRWAEAHDKKLDRLFDELEAMRAQQERDGRQLAVLYDRSERAARARQTAVRVFFSKRWPKVAAAALSAVATALATWWGAR
jgi:hypothetical protein